jgi:hypothetical protein
LTSSESIGEQVAGATVVVRELTSVKGT